MSKEKLKADIQEAKRWNELVESTVRMVERYGAPTLIQLSEAFGCSIDIVHNIGDAVDGLKIVGDPANRVGLRIVKTTGSN